MNICSKTLYFLYFSPYVLDVCTPLTTLCTVETNVVGCGSGKIIRILILNTA